MKKKLFLKNGAIMASSALLIRSLAMGFRIYLTGAVGAEGIGLYQLIMSVYLFFASLSTAGITLCATRLCGEAEAAGKRRMGRFAVERCLMIALLSGTILGCIMYFSSGFCAETLLHEGRAAFALKLLAPSLPFMAASACIRGYFCARRKTLPTCTEQILEQIIEMGVILLIFSLSKPANAEDACCRAVLGAGGAELVSFVYSMIWFRTDMRHYSDKKERFPHLGRKMLPIALPVTANACVRTGLSAAENALIPRGLKKYGGSSQIALSQYGVMSGMTMTVLVFPSVFILPFAALIIPEITEAYVRKSRQTIKHLSKKMLSLTIMYSIPVTVVFRLFGIKLCMLLFGNSEAGRYLAILAPVVPLMYLDSVVDGILKGMNRQTSYFVFNTIDSVIRVFLTYILLPSMGINGMLIVIFVSELLNTSMSLFRLIQLTKISVPIGRCVLRPLLCILVPSLFVKALPELPIPAADLIIKLIAVTLVFLIIMRLTNGKDRQGIRHCKESGKCRIICGIQNNDNSLRSP